MKKKKRSLERKLENAFYRTHTSSAMRVLTSDLQTRYLASSSTFCPARENDRTNSETG